MANKMNYNQLTLAALNCGAAGAAIIPGEQIVLSETFYMICKSNSCGYFNRCWMCPPDIGPIEELMAKVRSFPMGMLYQTIGEIEDSFDIEGMTAASRAHAQVSRRIQAAVRPMLKGEIFHLSCGGCSLCERCAKLDNEPCRFPDETFVPMEGAGIDVYNTTKDTQLKYINGQNTVTYFGLVLFKEQEDA